MFLGYAMCGVLFGFFCAVIAHFGFGFGLLGSFLVYSATGSVGFVATALLSIGYGRAVDDFEDAKPR